MRCKYTCCSQLDYCIANEKQEAGWAQPSRMSRHSIRSSSMREQIVTLSAEQTWLNACDIKASPDEGGLVRGEKKEKWMALCEQVPTNKTLKN